MSESEDEVSTSMQLSVIAMAHDIGQRFRQPHFDIPTHRVKSAKSAIAMVLS
jgi:hypothetical protein